MYYKKGQKGAGGAALLILIITIMVILYIVALPPEERAKLLADSTQDTGHGGINEAPFKTSLLSATPGRLFPPAPNEIDHSLPSFTIFTSVNAVELKRTNSMSIKKGIFSSSSGKLNFAYDRTSVENIMLSFNAKRSSGELVITLNEEEIYNNELQTKSPPPVPLPVSLLRPMNELTFEASSGGAAFWRVNSHDLFNVIVSGEVTDRTASMADQHYSITQKEFDVLEFAELSFLPNCDPQFTGRLRIESNSKEVFSGFADCGVPNKIEIAKELLKAGDNILTFTSEEGQYLVDLIKVTSKITGQDVPIFYFNLPDQTYELLYFNDALLFLTLRFADARSPKAGVLNVNGFETSFNVADIAYQVQIDPEFLLPGPNSILVIPQGQPMDVVELSVELA